ncbi:MAG: hypothetical protein AA908_05895 [Chlorobi bacterium NICIL-2]|nr:MAG: hypothetical protein AA908_05895 [Chlorobi bacterium NICIL-2]
MNVRLLLFLAMSAGIVVTCNAQQNTRWQALGNGLYSPLPYIYAVTAVGSDVFVGGIITRAGNLAVNNIARWNWQDRNWYALGAGANSNVFAIAPLVSGTDTLLVVGGSFDRVGTIPCEGVATWNQKTQQWDCLASSLVGGSAKRIASFYQDGDQLYVCGAFDSIGGIPASCLARYDVRTRQWQTLGQFEQRDDPNFGPPLVQQVVRIGTSLYAIGAFTHVDSIRSVCIARYDLTTGKWGSIPNSNFIVDGFNGVLPNAVVAVGDSLIIGGNFGTFGDLQARALLVYDTRTQQWSEFAGGVWRDTSTSSVKYYAVFALAYGDGHLYVGGSFEQAGGIPASNIAHYDFSTKQWEPLESGTNGRVLSLALTPDRLYVGGGFLTAGNTRVNYIAAWMRDTTVSTIDEPNVELPWRITPGSLHYRTHVAGPVQLALYDLRGRLVTMLKRAWQEAGDYVIELPSLIPGVYLLHLRDAERSFCRPVIIEP